MYYKLKVAFSKRYSPFQRIKRKIKKILGIYKETDISRFIIKYAKGKSFADIGALWGVDGKYSFLAEENGSTRVMAVDIYPPSKKFLEEKRARSSAVEFVQGDINLASTVNTIGKRDIVFCAGVLYHTPDPIHLLTRLRAICGETLILSTASIPEMPGTKNAAVFYPFLNENQRKIWNRGIGSQKAITGEYEPEEGYGNWFWGMTPSCLESMIRCAGFEVIERIIEPFNTMFVCRTTPIKFSAVSGEWNTPKDAEYAKFRK